MVKVYLKREKSNIQTLATVYRPSLWFCGSNQAVKDGFKHHDILWFVFYYSETLSLAFWLLLSSYFEASVFAREGQRANSSDSIMLLSLVYKRHPQTV